MISLAKPMTEWEKSRHRCGWHKGVLMSRQAGTFLRYARYNIYRLFIVYITASLSSCIHNEPMCIGSSNCYLLFIYCLYVCVVYAAFQANKVVYIMTSRPAVAGNPSCSVFKLGPKYNCEKPASNIALSYGVDVDKWSFERFTSLCLYLMQNYAAFRR